MGEDRYASQALSQQALRSGVLSDADQERLMQFAKSNPRLDDLKQWLREQAKLTEYQVEQLALGSGGVLRFGHYRVLDRLGGGGMGEVLLARHELLDRQVAVKTIHSQWAGDADMVQRFLQEIVSTAKLMHPHIVTTYDAGKEHGFVYLVMENLKGHDLEELVQREEQLDWQRAVKLIRQAAEGLQFAHERRVIHRDVTPANLMVLENDVVKVMDLGLARAIGRSVVDGRLTKAGSLMGTVDYVAPEQARDASQAGPSADIYSLGCTLYFCLTGEPPFPGGSLTEKLLRHISESAPDVRRQSDAPDSLAELVLQMMQKTPHDRPPGMQAVADALRRIEVTADSATFPPNNADLRQTRDGGERSDMEADDRKHSIAAEADPSTPSSTQVAPALESRPVVPPTATSAPAPARRNVALGGVGLLLIGLLGGWLWYVAPWRSVIPPAGGSGPPSFKGSGQEMDPSTLATSIVDAQNAHITAVAVYGGDHPALGPHMVFGWEDIDRQPTGTDLHAWRLAGDQPLLRLPDVPGPVSTIQFSPDRNLLAAGTGSWNSPVAGNVKIWEVTPSGYRIFADFPAHQNHVNDLVWWLEDKSERRLITCSTPQPDSSDSRLSVWDLDSGSQRVLEGQGAGISRLALVPSKDVLVAGRSFAAGRSDDPDQQHSLLELWELPGGVRQRRFTLEEPLIFRIIIDPLERYALIATGHGVDNSPPGNAKGRLYGWDYVSGEPEVLQASAQADFTGISFAPGGQRLLCLLASDEGAQVQWFAWNDQGLDGQPKTVEVPLPYAFTAEATSDDTAIIGGQGPFAIVVHGDSRTAVDLTRSAAVDAE